MYVFNSHYPPKKKKKNSSGTVDLNVCVVSHSVVSDSL